MRFFACLLLIIASGLAVAQESGAPAGSGFLSGIKQLGSKLAGGNDEPELLPPEQAFPLSVRVRDGRTLVADFGTAKDYYLYRDKVAFSVEGAADARIAKVAIPQGKMKKDPIFGETEVLYRPFQAVITLQREGAGAGSVKLAASYQGCNEPVGVCYPPINRTFDLVLPVVTAAASAVSGPAEAAPSREATQELFPDSGSRKAAPASESSQIAALFSGGSFWLVIASFFGFGLLLSFTPCMFPMIPILSGIIAPHGEHLTKRRGFVLSATYVLGMAVTYALAGIAAGLSGTMLSAALQNPWVLGTFALIFVALSFSMFGFYELQLPSVLQSRLTEASNRLHGGHFTGVFAMGALSAVIVGPCVAAPLAGALLYISQTGDVVLGGTALFTLALGMGAPLLAVGTSAGHVMPKAGPWMEAVNRFFGVLLLGTAIYLVSPVIPAVVHMLGWSALLIVSAIYLHAIDPLPAGASGYRKFWKGVGVIALLMGVALLVGALSGGRDILQPLSGLRSVSAGPAGSGVVEGIRFERVKTGQELDARLAQTGGRSVMLDFYADWCVSCKEMERFTFSDPRVKAKLDRMVLLQVDVTANTAEDAALLRRFGLFGPPGYLFFDPQGREIQGVRVIGFQDADRFLATLQATSG
ncbi:MAG: protein-disulfide reductase DsbD [Betaproteobacteria bacterium]|nr:protein-disulfide reductase DsbD [Betaproteobacteria bacterium]